MCSGLMFPQVLGIIQVAFTKTQRTKAIGFYGATIGLATILVTNVRTRRSAGGLVVRFAASKAG